VGALSNYIAQAQDLLHDPVNQMWTQTQLKGYVNEARNRVAQDTKCLRQYVASSTYPTVMVFQPGIEFINPQAFLPQPLGQNIIDIMGISILVNQERLSLVYKPFTWINAMMRSWTTYQQWPQFWTRLSPVQICIAPIPNHPYPTAWDVAVTPSPLINDAMTDDIPVPFQEPVQYWAAKKAKINQQSQGEAAFFDAQYRQSLISCARGYMGRVIQDPYQAAMQ
jgi:hypothetical protein